MDKQNKVTSKYKFMVLNNKCFSCCFRDESITIEHGLAYYKAKGSAAAWPLLEKEEDLPSRLLIENVLRLVRGESAPYVTYIKEHDWDAAIKLEEVAEELDIKPIIDLFSKVRKAYYATTV